MQNALPEPGQVVYVRQRPFVVADVRISDLPAEMTESGSHKEHLVSLSSVEDEGLGEELEVIWEMEPGAHCPPKSGLPQLEEFDPPQTFDAFLDAVTWGSVSQADDKALQAPFRSGIDVDDYQLDPVVRALQMPRVNLLIADDVGLGKTIEAGLVAQELILQVHQDLQRYTELRAKSATTPAQRFAAEFVLKLLKKRLFSCPAAFATTLEKHAKSVGAGTPSAGSSWMWSGPANGTFPIRRIDQVIYDQLSKAKAQVFLVTFAAHRVPLLCEHLGKAIDRGVEVTLLFESEKASAGQLSFDASNAFKDVCLDNVRLLHWPLEFRERNQAGTPGKLHVKCAVIDDTAIIGSANLTDDAFNRNMELGVIINDLSVVAGIREHFATLERNGILKRV